MHQPLIEDEGWRLRLSVSDAGEMAEDLLSVDLFRMFISEASCVCVCGKGK